MSAAPATFRIGGELEVGRIGFGAMRVRREPGRGVEVIRRAVELGATLIDTADVYGAGASEELVAEALHPYPEGVVVATKGGITYDGGRGRTRDGRPEYLRRACERSLARLRLERIDVYQLHRHDPEVPLEESVGALAELRREGKIRHVGLSNVSLEQLRRAQAVVEIATVQNEYNRGLTVSEEVLRGCEADGIAFLPWRPLGDWGAADPVSELRWLLARSPVVLPIPGTSSIGHLEENMRALSRPAAAA